MEKKCVGFNLQEQGGCADMKQLLEYIVAKDRLTGDIRQEPPWTMMFLDDILF